MLTFVHIYSESSVVNIPEASALGLNSLAVFPAVEIHYIY